MNWHAVAVVALIAVALAAVVSFASMMSYLEMGPTRTALLLSIPTAVLFAGTALLAGVVWA